MRLYLLYWGTLESFRNRWWTCSNIYSSTTKRCVRTRFGVSIWDGAMVVLFEIVWVTTKAPELHASWDAKCLSPSEFRIIVSLWFSFFYLRIWHLTPQYRSCWVTFSPAFARFAPSMPPSALAPGQRLRQLRHFVSLRRCRRSLWRPMWPDFDGFWHAVLHRHDINMRKIWVILWGNI